MQLSKMIETRAATSGEALEFEGRPILWVEVGQAISAIRAQFDAAALSYPLVVTVVCRNVPGHIVAVLALLGAGHTVRLLSADQPSTLIADQIAAIACAVVVTDETLSDDVIRDAITAAGSLRLSVGRRDCSFTVVQHGKQGAFAPSDPATAIIVNSSGTTGTPKPIPISWRAIEMSVGMGKSAATEPATGRSPGLLYAPLAHTSGIIMLLQAVADGRPLVVLEKFAIAAFRDVLRRHRPKYLALFPPIIRMILDSDLTRDDLSSLVAARVGTAALQPEVQDDFETRFGVPLLTNYGATEFIGAAASWTLADHRVYGKSKRGSVGRAFADVQLRVVEPESSAVLGDGVTGILEVQSGRMGAAWIRTTDLASIDADGFLYIHGRADDAINRGGFKILASEVSATLARHEKIAEAYVFGLADRRLGQVPVAAVEPKAGVTDLTPEDVALFARQHLPPYKVPAQIKIVEALPRTISLKVKRVDVQRLFENTAHN
jgi:long-chain acyl-CoA synthetase